MRRARMRSMVTGKTAMQPAWVAARGTNKVSVIVMLAVAGSLALGAMRSTGASSQLKVATGLTEAQQISHVLNRLTYGPRPGDLDRVKRTGIASYIEEQLHPERLDDAATEARLAGLPSLRMPISELYDKYPEPSMLARELGFRPQDIGAREQQPDARQQILTYYTEHGLKRPQSLLQELHAQKLIRAVSSERQLQEVMTDFWFNHFNVFWGKGADRWFTTAFEIHAIRPHALGTFKDLLLATAKSPAMLFYLDNYLSSALDARAPEGKPGSGINENYARELLELHTLGVEGGYTQQDVEEVARCFTGWTIERPRQSGRFVFLGWMHDAGEKQVLGHRIPPGGGMTDGEIVIDILAHHPSTARNLATKLVRRFVSDDPPPIMVDRVAAAYMQTGGDLRAVLRTLFTLPEFYAPQAYRSKIKSPFELAISAIRALGGDTDGSPPLAQRIAKMGQPLYQAQPPTGYPDRAAWWINTGTLLERLNFGLAFAANHIPGTTVDWTRVAPGVDGPSLDWVIARAIAVLLGDALSPQTRATLERQLGATDAEAVQPPADSQFAKVFGLVLGSPDFQRR